MTLWRLVFNTTIWLPALVTWVPKTSRDLFGSSLGYNYAMQVHTVERSLLNLPAKEKIASNFEEEWRFHATWNLLAQVTKKINHSKKLLNY